MNNAKRQSLTRMISRNDIHSPFTTVRKLLAHSRIFLSLQALTHPIPFVNCVTLL
jgi:hypothetical protein